MRKTGNSRFEWRKPSGFTWNICTFPPQEAELVCFDQATCLGLAVPRCGTAWRRGAGISKETQTTRKDSAALFSTTVLSSSHRLGTSSIATLRERGVQVHTQYTTRCRCDRPSPPPYQRASTRVVRAAHPPPAPPRGVGKHSTRLSPPAQTSLNCLGAPTQCDSSPPVGVVPMQRSTTPVNSPLAIAPMSVLSMPANCGRRAVQIVHRTWGTRKPPTANHRPQRVSRASARRTAVVRPQAVRAPSRARPTLSTPRTPRQQAREWRRVAPSSCAMRRGRAEAGGARGRRRGRGGARTQRPPGRTTGSCRARTTPRPRARRR